MLIYKGFIKVDYDTFYPLSRIVEVRYWNCSPDFTEIVFDNGKVVKNRDTVLRTMDEINENKTKEK